MELKQTLPLITLSEIKVITPLAEWMSTFLRAKQSEQVSRNTIRCYSENLKTFLLWCDKQYLKTIEDITADCLRLFLIHLKDTGHNPGGIHGHFRVIRTFLRWYETETEPEGWHNPCRKVKPPHLSTEALDAVSLEDVERLYKAATGSNAIRDKAIILTLADTGLRAAELLALDTSDTDVFTGQVLVRHGKGNKSRTVFLGKRTRRAVHLWQKQRKNNSPAMFTSDEGDRMKYSTLRQILRRLSVKAGIPTPSPHSFRRCFAINFLRNGGDLLSLQRLLGHSGLSLLARYAKQNTADLAASHAAHSPLDGLL
jgi:integrase/recombinase XerD